MQFFDKVSKWAAGLPQVGSPSSFFPIKLDESDNQKVEEAVRIITENLKYTEKIIDEIVNEFASPTSRKDLNFFLVLSNFFQVLSIHELFKNIYFPLRKNVLEATLIASLKFGWNFRDVLTLWQIDGLARNIKYEEEKPSEKWIPVKIEEKLPSDEAEARSWARSIILHERWGLDFLTPIQSGKSLSVRKKEHDNAFNQGFEKISVLFPENPIDYLSRSIELKQFGKIWHFRTKPEYQSTMLSLQHAAFQIKEAKIPEEIENVILRPPFASLSYLNYNSKAKDPNTDIKTMIRVLRASTQNKGKAKKESRSYDTYELYKAFASKKIPEEVKKYIDINCPSSLNCHSYVNALRFELLLRLSSFLPDNVWLPLIHKLYGPEPLWPSSLITERFYRANDPDHPWATANNPKDVEGVLGMTAGLEAHQHEDAPGISIKAISPSPVKAYFFPGRTDQRALILGGVHGAEQSGIEVVEKLRIKLATAPRLPYYTTIIIPTLFPDSRAFDQQVRDANTTFRGKNIQNQFIGGRYARVRNGGKHQITIKGVKSEHEHELFKLVEPNRNLPHIGDSLHSAELIYGLRDPDDPNKPLTGDLTIPYLLPENKFLITLIERFRPSRIASIHGHLPPTDKTVPGDAPGIYVDPRGSIDRKSDKAITEEGKYDDNLAREMLNYARREGLPNNIGGTVHYKASHPKGTSLGMWGPAPINEGGPWDRPAITTITVEVESNFPSNEDPTGEMEKKEQIHADTLQNVFLEQH